MVRGKKRIGAWGGALGGGVTAVLATMSFSVKTVQSLVSEPEPVIWVEEDWVMVLNEPDDGIHSPQFHTVMAPSADVEGNYAQVLWNYRETPDFSSGGIQLQSYDGEDLLRVRTVETRSLSSEAETISWTQGLWTDGAVLTFYIDNGNSTTWGSFGRDMRIDESATVPNLNDYDPDASVANCMVTFGSNRVETLMITQVRRYGESGLISVDSTPRVVYDFGDDFVD